MTDNIFEQMDFVENPMFEKIIDDLIQKKHSIVDTFFAEEEVKQFRNTLLSKYESERFKKSAIGNKFNEEIDKTIRGDFIYWINEAHPSTSE